MSPDDMRARDLFPRGFLPLRHVKHETGGFIFPEFLIKEIERQEGRSLQRFDADFDLPDHLVPEFPPAVAAHDGGSPAVGRDSGSHAGNPARLWRALDRRAGNV